MRYQTAAAPVLKSSSYSHSPLHYGAEEEDYYYTTPVEEHALLPLSLSSYLPSDTAQDLANVHFHFEEEEEYVFDHHHSDDEDENPFCTPDQTMYIHSFFPVYICNKSG